MQQVPPRVYALVLGKVVASLRKKRGFNQTYFAAAIGVSQSTLSRIERGETMPDAYTYQRIAAALGMSVQQLTSAVDEAVAKTQQAASKVFGKSNGSFDWEAVLGVVGVLALAGLVGFAVAVIVDELNNTGRRR